MTFSKKSRIIIAVLFLIAITYMFQSIQTDPPILEAPYIEIEKLTIQIETDQETYSLGDTINVEVYAHNNHSTPVKLLPQTTMDFNIVYLNDINAIKQVTHVDYFNSSAREQDSMLIPAGQRTLLDTKSFKIQQTGIIQINFLETISDISIPLNIYSGRLDFTHFDDPETVEEMLKDLQEVVGDRNIKLRRLVYLYGKTVKDYQEFLEYANRTTRDYISYLNETGNFRVEVKVNDQQYVWSKIDEDGLKGNPPDEFLKNLGVIVSFQDGIDPNSVTISFPELDDNNWINCVKTSEWFNMSGKVSFLLHSHHPTRLSYPNYCTVTYETNDENRTIDQIKLDRNIIGQTYSAFYQDKIQYIEVKIGENKTSSRLVWEGSFGNVPRECVRYYTGNGTAESSTEYRIEDNGASIIYADSRDYYLLVNDNNTPQSGEGFSYSSYLNVASEQILASEKLDLSGPSYTYRNIDSGKFTRVIEPFGLWVDEMPLPFEQVEMIITARVGLDYFERYFDRGGYQTHDGSAGSWNQHVDYNYHLEIGNYSNSVRVEFKFDLDDYLLCYYYYLDNGLPGADNLMPFNVTCDEAIEIALSDNEGIDPPLEVEARIGYMWRTRADTVIGINEYTWIVLLYQDQRDASNGDIIEYFIDLYSGEILRIDYVSWSSSA